MAAGPDGCSRAGTSSNPRVHAILDITPSTSIPKVRGLLGRHPGWTFQFTPTLCSWANAVEGFFETSSLRRVQRGVFRSLVDLQATINRHLEHNRKPKPFAWTADPDRIIEKVNRGHRAIVSDY